MKYYTLSAQETADILKTDTTSGLSETEAQKRLKSHGKNFIEGKRKPNIAARFFSQFNDFMIMLLLGAAAVSFLTSVIIGNADITESVIILAIVVLNASLGTFQEVRAEQSLENLKKLSAPTATVIRDGAEKKIPSELVVPGDIILLRRGDVVCADCRLIKSDTFFVDESAFTGETLETEKSANEIFDEFTPLSERRNTVFSSSSVTRGTAIAITVNTGMMTEVGKIADMLSNSECERTPLQKRLADTGKVLGIICLFICGIIFLIGAAKHIPPFEMFMTSVSLAVAAIPEGLPATVTILLALGVLKMSKHNAIVRHLPSVETLGCATVICTDKTGTLTLNKMRVSKIHSENSAKLLRLAVLCSEDGEYINPTDRAVCDCAKTHGIDCILYKKSHKKVAEIPFDASRKRMSVIADGNLIVKGAPEYIIPLCSKSENNECTVPFSPAEKKRIYEINTEMTKNALRVIAVAYKASSDISDECNLIFVGLIGISDPPRPEARTAVLTAKRAGIRTVMLTGDHALTALAVARMTGIADGFDKAVIGTELDKKSDDEICELVKTHNVFARVTPEHKLRIIKAMKQNGEICAMTGDGVNDAPALKGADIGCSMGISGTDVAKSASDIILTDDNFATIVYAVGEGRRIYDNIKKSVKFLLSTNIGEILTVMFGIIFGCVSPLSATELLWINLVTDSLPAIALGLDPPQKDIMLRAPISPKQGIFSKGLWAKISLEGLMIGSLSLFAHAIGLYLTKDEQTARTMAFFVLAVSQLTHAFNMRSEKSVIKDGIFKNKYLVFSYVLGVSLQFLLMYIKSTAELFDISPLNGICLALSVALSVMPFVIVEFQKYLNERKG